jgi:hypothetical protein
LFYSVPEKGKVMMTILTPVTAATLFAGMALAQSPLIYGVAPDSKGASLYRISATTGAATMIGPTGFERVPALAFAPNGTLYGIGQNGAGTLALLTLNTSSGAGAQVAPLTGIPKEVEDMTFGPDATLFASTATGQAYRINPATGAATPLARGQASGIFYRSEGLQLRSTNPVADAPARSVGLRYGTGFGNRALRANSMKLEVATGTLYASLVSQGDDGPRTSLGKINPATGEVTRVGPTVNGLHALVIAAVIIGPPVPAPPSWMLLLTGILVVSGWNRWRAASNRAG